MLEQKELILGFFSIVIQMLVFVILEQKEPILDLFLSLMPSISIEYY